MPTRRSALLGFGLAAALAPSAHAQGAERARRAEVRALQRFAETTHPRGLAMAQDSGWIAHWAALADSAERTSFADYFMGMKAGLALFHDGHTTIPMSTVTTGAFGLRLPLIAKPFYDGLYIVNAKDDAAPLLGARIARIGGQDVSTLAERFATTWPANNPAWAHHDAGLMLIPGVLHGMGVVSGDDDAAVRIDAITPSGRHVRANVRPSAGAREGRSPMARPPLQHEVFAAETTTLNYARSLPETRTLYVACNTLDTDVDETVRFTREVFTAMEAPEHERLVLDIRRNGGGNNFNAEALRRGIGRSRFNRPGGLYVLIGPQTFSAAQNFANRLERETFALFVGEPTGGAPNHFGDAREFPGATSGFACYVSSLPWFDSVPMDQRQWIMPDLPAPELFADFAAGRDPALELALIHQTDAPADELTRERIFYYERPSQSGVWTPFWMAEG